MLFDDISKKIMVEFLRAHIQSGIYALPNNPTNHKYFFDGEKESERKPLYRQLDDEIWVNCGANTGDTIFAFFNNGLKAKKVYAFEGDLTAFGSLNCDLGYLPDEYRDVVLPINLYIDENTGFEEYIKERVTLINADLDCHEMGMLQSIKEIIRKDRPVIAICVYHKSEDLVEIPQYIDSLVDHYCYLLRKYDANIYNSSRTNELVLYAIPRERMI